MHAFTEIKLSRKEDRTNERSTTHDIVTDTTWELVLVQDWAIVMNFGSNILVGTAQSQ